MSIPVGPSYNPVVGLGSRVLMNQIIDHVLSLGIFDSANKHEPKAAPQSGLSCAVWLQTIRPIVTSGLNSSSVVAIFSLRIYTNMLQEPQDAIDENMLEALDQVMASFSGDLTLQGSIRTVDLMGEYSLGLAADAGYVNQDDRLYRVITITVPLIINDAWDQEVQ